MEQMTVKAVNKAKTGFMAEGKENWFNAAKSMGGLFTDLARGIKIEADVLDDKWITKYRVIGTPVLDKPADKSVITSFDTNTHERIARGNATNAVLGSRVLGELVVKMTGSESEAIQMLKNLTKAYATYISTGEFGEVS